MQGFEEDNESDKKKNLLTTFPVPFTLEEIDENFTITSNTPTKPSKEKIINQAFKFDSLFVVSAPKFTLIDAH